MSDIQLTNIFNSSSKTTIEQMLGEFVNLVKQKTITWVFVCVEVLRPSQPNGVMSSAVSLPNHTFTGQA